MGDFLNSKSPKIVIFRGFPTGSLALDRGAPFLPDLATMGTGVPDLGWHWLALLH